MMDMIEGRGEIQGPSQDERGVPPEVARFQALNSLEAAQKACDDTCDTLESVFKRAREDLRAKNPVVKADAYYWFTCKDSELYQVIAKELDLPLSPAKFRKDILDAKLPDYPAEGISEITLNTDHPDIWCYCAPGEDANTYLARLVKDSELMCAAIAEINGCAILTRGAASKALDTALDFAASVLRSGTKRVKSIVSVEEVADIAEEVPGGWTEDSAIPPIAHLPAPLPAQLRNDLMAA